MIRPRIRFTLALGSGAAGTGTSPPRDVFAGVEAAIAQTRTVVSEMQMKISLIMAGVFLSASLCQANCVKNARGQTVCNDGQSAAGYNPNTGKGATANKNSNGVTTTQTTRGSKSKTRNGKGVATGPNGTTCAKSANNAGCTPPK
jgi:hypothetical protein